MARNPRDSRRFIVPSGKVGVSRFRVMERGQTRGTYLRGTIIIRGSSAENDAFVAQNRAVRARQFCKLSPGRRGSNSLSRPCSPVVFPTMLLFAIFSLHFSLRVSPLFPRFSSHARICFIQRPLENADKACSFNVQHIYIARKKCGCLQILREIDCTVDWSAWLPTIVDSRTSKRKADSRELYGYLVSPFYLSTRLSLVAP